MAYKLAIEHFDIQKNALRILQIYEEHLIEHPPRTRCIGNGAAVDGRVSATSPGKRPVRF